MSDENKNLKPSLNEAQERLGLSGDDIGLEEHPGDSYIENYVPDSEYYDNGESQSAEYDFEDKKSKKKKKKWFGKKSKDPEYDDSQDLYYGISMKPLEEFRIGYDSTEEIRKGEDTFAKLFDDTIPSLDEEIEKNFQRIQMERRRRVAAAVETAGIDVDEVADELGIVAPMPVTSFSADPYAKQHGIENEQDETIQDDFQRATMETAKGQTMEIKLNILNDTVELQKSMNIPVVQEENLVRVREEVEGLPEETEETETSGDFQQLNDLTSYRERTCPVHFLNIDIIQSAIISESESYVKKEESGSRLPKPFSRYAQKIEPIEDESEGESIDDYTSPADAKSISSELKGLIKKLSIRLAVTSLSLVVLFITSLVCQGTTSSTTAITYLVINAIFMLLPLGLAFKNMTNGFKSLMKFDADSDSPIAIAAIAALIQTVFGFLNIDKMLSGTVHLYGVVIVFALLLNNLGKLSMVKRIYGNFRYVSSREQKYAVRTFEDYNTALKLAKDSVAEAPSIAYQQKAGFLKRFLQLSYTPDPAENASRKMAPLSLILSLVLCLGNLFITRDIAAAITVFAAATCISVPVTNLLGLNVPIGKLCAKTRRAGAMVIGYDGINAVASTNAVMMDINELFPEGTVVLDGVKTFGSDPEKAIFTATALVKEVGGTLGDVFAQVINERENDIPHAKAITLEDENGISGKVDGETVLIGNRAILMNHGIEPPERDDVIKYTIGGKKALFVAVNGKLEAMLVLSYRADKRKKIEIQRLEQNGVSIIVRSTDANITTKFLGGLFGISESSISVVCGNLGNVYKKIMDSEIPRADALVATKGRVESMMSVISACIAEKKITGLIVAVQNISIVIGFVLVAFLAMFSGAPQLTATALLLYEIFWLVVVMVIPKIKLK